MYMYVHIYIYMCLNNYKTNEISDGYLDQKNYLDNINFTMGSRNIRNNRL